MINGIFKTRAAEKRRGCVIDLSLSSAGDVAKQSGVVTGTPSYSVGPKGGIKLDGTGDWLTYTLDGMEFNNAEISIVIEFTPNFAVDDGVLHDFFVTNEPTNDYLFAIITANGLRLDLGNTTIGSTIALATYQDYWRAYERNVIVISGTTGNTSVWLNGNVIMNAAATAWTPTVVTDLTVGNLVAGGWKFPGTIHKFQVYQSILTAQEAKDLASDDTFNYNQKAVVNLQMDMASNDPSNLGDDVVVDGDMEAAGTADWTAGGGSALSKSTASPYSGTQALRVTKDAAAADWASQNVMTAGKYYRVRGYARGDGTVNPAVGTNGAYLWTGTTSTSWQAFDYYTLHANIGIYLYANVGGGAGNWVEFDDITVNEVRPRTLDVSGNNNHALLGTADPTTQPTKLAKRGYSFDGGDYMTINHKDELNFSLGYTLAALVSTDTLDGNKIIISKEDGTTGYRLWQESVGDGFWSVSAYDSGGTLRRATIAVPVDAGRYTSVIGTVQSDGYLRLYLNGILVDTGGDVTVPSANTADLYIGKQYDDSRYFDGDMGCVMALPIALTPTQIKDLHLQMMRRINKV